MNNRKILTKPALKKNPSGWLFLGMFTPKFFAKPTLKLVGFDDSIMTIDVYWLWFARRRYFLSVEAGWRYENGEIVPIPESLALTEIRKEWEER